MQIDIDFSDVITPEATTIVYPAILGHAAPVLRAYNRETVIAEKFETMVKLGELNSRMKDFFDIWLLAKTGQFRMPELSHAIEQTFSNFANQQLPKMRRWAAEKWVMRGR
jgi:hypothetical protein